MARKMNHAFGLISATAIFGAVQTAQAEIVVNFETTPVVTGETYGGYPDASSAPVSMTQTNGSEVASVPNVWNQSSASTYPQPQIESTAALDGSQSLQYTSNTGSDVSLYLSKDRSGNPLEVLGDDVLSTVLVKLTTSGSVFKLEYEDNTSVGEYPTYLELDNGASEQNGYSYSSNRVASTPASFPGFYTPGDVLMISTDINFNTNLWGFSILDTTQGYQVVASENDLVFYQPIVTGVFTPGTTTLYKVVTVGAPTTYADDFTFQTVVPEPLPLGLVGALALPLTLRRRR